MTPKPLSSTALGSTRRASRALALAALASASLSTHTLAAQAGPASEYASVEKLPPNIVVIVADDVGVDMVSAYGESSSAPCTANLDALAAEGLLFRNAWACPVCSPTRAALLTGRFGFRTGIGGLVTNNEPGLSLAEQTVPEVLSRYASACLGKWHLAGNSGATHPNLSGFGHYAGFLRGSVNDYFSWPKVVNGQTSTSNVYTTTAFTNEAIAQIASLPEPWILFVNYNAAHTPFHVPPASLCAPAACASTWCDSLPPNPNDRGLARAMMEALDFELGRLLDALDAAHPDSYVFFLGDNGTTGSASIQPFTANHAKGSLFEGGINVPFIVRGPGVRRGECDALVSVVDLHATFAELGRVRSTAEDSVSLVPYFQQPGLALRDWVYSELFSPNGGAPPFASHERAIRDARYKLIRRTGQSDQFFDLALDPFELNDLAPSMSTAEQRRYDTLAAELQALGVG